MKSQSWFFRLVAGGALVWTSLAGAGTVTMLRTPILNATLPAGTTYEVESSTNGSTWQPTGVLVAGEGSASAVRLDGFPDSLHYRYAQIGAVAAITPTVTSGLSLSNSFPGASEVRIESTPVLPASVWTTRKFVFPDLNGSLLNAVANPTEFSEFFRAVQPAMPLDPASVASYQPDPNFGYSGFGIVADDMPQLYRDGFIAAPCPAFYHRGGANAAAAGECYELTGPFGTTTVIISDIDDVPPPGTCEIGRTYMDIGTPAFTNLFLAGAGYGTVTYRLVPAPVTGNVKLVVPISSGVFYFELRPYNHRAGIGKIEIQSSGSSTWTELPRSAYNSFVYNGAAISFPLSVRVTSRFGESIVFPPIPSLTSGQRITASAQFTVFPELDPAPVWILPPVYRDSLSNVLGSTWTAVPYLGATVNAANAAAAYQGAAGISISNVAGFAGVNFFSLRQFPGPANSAFELAIRTTTATAATNLTVSFQGYDNTGSAASSSTVPLPAISNTWRIIRIPLDPAGAPARLAGFRLSNNGSSAAPPVDVDSIFFRQP